MKVIVCVLLAIFGIALAAPPNIDSRIIGGEEATRGAYPFIGSLSVCVLSFCQHSCGVVLINPYWVLTAAHCITDLPSISTLNVLLGVLNLNDNNPERQYIRVVGSILHPDYEGGVNPNDIALLRLQTAAVLNSQVQFAQLPEAGEEPEGKSAVVGWGSIGGIIIPQMPNTLQRVDIPIIDIQECSTAITTILEGRPHPLHKETNVCTGPLNLPISVCSGDSGGPLISDGKVVGIVSWGISPCGTVGAPSVYVKVSSFIHWINENIY